MTEHVASLYRTIYAVVRRIPTGHVATYGQVAELAGIPGGARVAGAAMKTSKPTDRLPWQRVIGKAGKNRGRIAIHDPVGAAVQRQLLGDKGVTVGDTGLDRARPLRMASSRRGRPHQAPQAGPEAHRRTATMTGRNSPLAAPP